MGNRASRRIEDAAAAAQFHASHNREAQAQSSPWQEATAALGREDRLTEEKDRAEPLPDMPLKHGGGSMDVRWLNTWTRDLRELLEEKPHHFQSLLKLVNDKSSTVRDKHRLNLRKWGFLDEIYTPLPDIPKVLKASLREVGDGYCIVDPIEAKSPEELSLVQKLNEQFEKQEQSGLERLARRLFNDETGSKGRG